MPHEIMSKEFIKDNFIQSEDMNEIKQFIAKASVIRLRVMPHSSPADQHEIYVTVSKNSARNVMAEAKQAGAIFNKMNNVLVIG